MAAVAGPMARATVRAVTAEGVGPRARPGKSVPAAVADPNPRTAEVSGGAVTRKAPHVNRARPRPEPAPKDVRAPRADAVAPKAADPSAPRENGVAVPKTVSVRDAALRTVSVPVAGHQRVPRARVAARTRAGDAAPRMVTVPVVAPTTREQAGVAGPDPALGTPANANTVPAPRAAALQAEAAGPPEAPEAVVVAVDVGVPARRSPTTVTGSSGSCPRRGNPRWPSAG